MENRKEKIKALTTNFHAFLIKNKMEFRLKQLLILNEEELKFLNEFNCFNIDRSNIYNFFEVTYEGSDYVIGTARKINSATVIRVDGDTDLFFGRESELLLYEYLQDSGAITAAEKITPEKMKENY